MSVLRAEVAARLKVYESDDSDSYIELPVASCSMNYAVSELPSCSVQLALGKNVSRPGVQEAALSDLLDRSGMPKAELEVKVIGDWTSKQRWNEEWQVVFEGRLVSESTSITRGRANLSLTLVHWLADLQSGTVLPSYAHPASNHNPLNSIVSFGGRPGDNTPGPSMIGSFADANALVTRSDFTEDLWANGIKSMIANLLTTELEFAGELASRTCFDVVDRPIKPSQKLKDAFKRIEGPVTDTGGANDGGDASSLGSDYSKYAKPLSFTDAAQDFGIQTYISQTITHDPTNTFQTSNLWELLIRRLLPRFGLAIIPRVKSAIIAPYLPALRPTFEHAIHAGDIRQIDDVKKLKRLAKASFIYLPGKAAWGADPGILGDDARGFTGCFYPDDPDTGSSMLYAKPPAWLVMAAKMGGGAADYVNTENGVPRIRGGAGNPAADADADLTTAAEATNLASAELLDKYAAIRYYTERLRGHSVTVHGKLRFDIAPGSVVRIQMRLDDIQGLGGQLVNLVGYVERITTVIDANRKEAMTSFKLGSIRTEEQNESDKFTIAEEPLFGTGEPFTGCSLLDEYTYDEN